MLSPASSPTPRSLVSGCDAGPMGLLMFGGEHTSYYSNETWRWANGTWTQIPTGNAPSPRGGGGMAYDPTRNRVVYFGGWGGFYLSDTWEFDGSAWSNRTPATSPAGRDWPAMAFDPLSQRVILHGGHDWTRPSYADTWAWDGSAWTQLAPSVTPGSRFGAAFSVFSSSGVLALHGGAEQNATTTLTHDDTWLWIGFDWVLVSPTSPMPGRYFSQVAYDRLRERLVVQGGTDDIIVFNDVWEFDGSNWAQRQPAGTSPTIHDGLALFDPQLGEVVVFGGSPTVLGRATINNETRTLGPTTPAIGRSFGNGCGNAPTLDGSHLAWLGGAFQTDCTGAIANGALMFVAGFSRTLAGGATPLPLALDPWGMPGCALLVDPVASLFVIADAAGNATNQFAVPNTPGLLGIWIYSQVAMVSPGSNTAGVVLGNAVEHRLGGR
ncbi:MAG: hypothetical protein KDC48_08780 [Planctomycetes bacterium]|nr:hypothetical protein [Planctomycetota bacterium]